MSQQFGSGCNEVNYMSHVKLGHVLLSSTLLLFFASGCVTGPIRSTTLGHSQYATYEWTKKSPIVLKPFAAIGGTTMDITVFALDTATKTVVNIVVRPCWDILSMWDCHDGADVIASSLATAIVLPLWYPFGLAQAGIEEGKWDQCFGDAAERKIKRLIAEGRYGEAAALINSSYGIAENESSFTPYCTVCNETQSQKWREALQGQLTETEESASSQEADELRRSVNALLTQEKFAEAERLCTQADGQGASGYDIRIANTKKTLLERVYDRWCRYEENKLRASVDILLNDANYEGAVSLCESFDVNKVAGRSSELRRYRGNVIVSIRSKQVKKLKDDFSAKISRMIDEGMLEEAGDACQGLDVDSIPDARSELVTLRDEMTGLVDAAIVKKIKDEWCAHVNDLVREQKIEEALAYLEALEIKNDAKGHDELLAYKADLQKDVLAEQFTALRKRITQQTDAYAEDHKYREALAYCEKFEQEKYPLLKEKLGELLKKTREGVLTRYAAFSARELEVKVTDLVRSGKFQEALKVCDDFKGLKIEGQGGFLESRLREVRGYLLEKYAKASKAALQTSVAEEIARGNFARAEKYCKDFKVDNIEGWKGLLAEARDEALADVYKALVASKRGHFSERVDRFLGKGAVPEALAECRSFSTNFCEGCAPFVKQTVASEQEKVKNFLIEQDKKAFMERLDSFLKREDYAGVQAFIESYKAPTSHFEIPVGDEMEAFLRQQRVRVDREIEDRTPSDFFGIALGRVLSDKQLGWAKKNSEGLLSLITVEDNRGIVKNTARVYARRSDHVIFKAELKSQRFPEGASDEAKDEEFKQVARELEEYLGTKAISEESRTVFHAGYVTVTMSWRFPRQKYDIAIEAVYNKLPSKDAAEK